MEGPGQRAGAERDRRTSWPRVLLAGLPEGPETQAAEAGQSLSPRRP